MMATLSSLLRSYRAGIVAAIMILAAIGGMTTVWAQSSAVGAAPSQAAYDQPLRPQFHWTPRTDYTNDPNGLIFYKG